jgi:2-keto-4-pentenoate hydratase/2-oxohepta-3-ene-1,7-dioic acid hydratase in catechol pathway
MNQNNEKNKTKEFEKEMDFYVPVGAILVELDESENPNYTIVMLGSED